MKKRHYRSYKIEEAFRVYVFPERIELRGADRPSR